MTAAHWTTEAAMVADFSAWVATQGVGNRNRPEEGWTVYAETAGWDLLLVRADGFQIGVEAKLALNAKVLCQALAHESYEPGAVGPDCRAVLVPAAKAVNGLATIARRLGLVVILAYPPGETRFSRVAQPVFRPELPYRTEDVSWREEWPEHAPDRRHALPEYVPDVTGGHPAPLALTRWKIGALKAQIILETQGSITRGDFKALGIDSSRWTQFWLRSDGNKGWIRTDAMPDFKAQHPVNYEQIKADAATWMAKLPPRQPQLTGAA